MDFWKPMAGLLQAILWCRATWRDERNRRAFNEASRSMESTVWQSSTARLKITRAIRIHSQQIPENYRCKIHQTRQGDSSHSKLRELNNGREIYCCSNLRFGKMLQGFFSRNPFDLRTFIRFRSSGWLFEICWLNEHVRSIQIDFIGSRPR